jgi:hypothetical protein
VSDPLALSAARAVLEGWEPDPQLDRWITAFTRLGLIAAGGAVQDPTELCRRAGRFADLNTRPGLAAFATPGARADELVDRLDRADIDYALSGAPAMQALGIIPTNTWVVVYVPDTARAGDALLLPRYSPGQGAPVIVLPFDGRSERGRAFGCAAPLQVVLDCFSGPGRMTDMAEALAARWSNANA